MSMMRIRLKRNEFQAVQFDGTQTESIVELDTIKYLVVSIDTMCPVDVGDWIIYMDGEPHAVITDEAFKEHYEILEEELKGDPSDRLPDRPDQPNQGE